MMSLNGICKHGIRDIFLGNLVRLLLGIRIRTDDRETLGKQDGLTPIQESWQGHRQSPGEAMSRCPFAHHLNVRDAISTGLSSAKTGVRLSGL